MYRDQTGLMLQETNTGMCVLVRVKLHPVVSGKGWCLLQKAPWCQQELAWLCQGCSEDLETST